MKIVGVFQIVALCLVALMSNQTIAARNQAEYTGVVFHLRRYSLTNELIEWLARNVEQHPMDAYNCLYDLGRELTDSTLTDEASRNILSERYRWNDFRGSIGDLRALLKGLTIAVVRRRISEGDKQVCVTGNYKGLLNTIKWIYSLEGNTSEDEFIPLNDIQAPVGYSKFFELVKRTSQEIMTFCVEHIQEAYDSLDPAFGSDLDYMMEVYASLSGEEMQKRLYEVSIGIDSLDSNFVDIYIDKAMQDQLQQLRAQRRMLVAETNRNLREKCVDLVGSQKLALSIGIYELARGTNPQLVQPLADLASSWKFKKLREYNRLCSKYLIERRA